MLEKIKNQIDKLNAMAVTPGATTTSLGQTLDAAGRDSGYGELLELLRCNQQSFFHNDENGVIVQLFQRLGTTNKIFVQLGAGDRNKDSTLDLMLLKDWRGFWLDSNGIAVDIYRSYYRKQVEGEQLKLAKAHLSKENIVRVLEDMRVPAEPDLLSVALDEHTGSSLDTCLKMYRPRVIIAQYYASPRSYTALASQYANDTTTDLGCTLEQIQLLGQNHGYSFLGSDCDGFNTLLVRNDLIGGKLDTPVLVPNWEERPTKTVGAPAIYCESDQGYFFVDPKDDVVGGTILRCSTWEQKITNVAQSTIGLGDLVLDIGAHIGWYSVLASKAVGPTGLVVAVEPEPGNFSLLLRNLGINNCSQQVQTHQLAISDNEEELVLELCDDNTGDHRLRRLNHGNIIAAQMKEDGRASIQVKSFTLDKLMDSLVAPRWRDQPISLMKIDSQGSEIFTFRQGQNTLKRVQVLLAEYSPYMLQRLGCDPAEFWHLLEQHFIVAFVLAVAGREDLKEIPDRPLSLNELKNQISHEPDPLYHLDLAFYKQPERLTLAMRP